MWTKTNIKNGKKVTITHEEAHQAALAEVEKGDWIGMVTEEELAIELMHTMIGGERITLNGFEYAWY